MALTQRQLEWAKANGINPEKVLPVATLSDKVTPDAVYSYLSNKGIGDVHAKGIIANIKAESDFNPEAYGDNGTSAGLFQHHKERLAGLQSNPEWQDWKKQIDYALNEDEGRDYLAQKFNRPEEASAYFTKNFERPANAEYEADRRKSFIPNIAPTTRVLTERQKKWAKENGVSIPGEKEAPKEEGILSKSIRGWKSLASNPETIDSLKRATVAAIPPAGLLPGLSDTRKEMASEIAEVPEQLKERLGMNLEYNNKGINFVRNINKGIIDAGVGFPAQVASGIMNLPEELASDIKDPGRLIDVAKQAGKMLAQPFDPREYSANKIYEDPVGRVMLGLQAVGLVSGAKGLFNKPIAPRPAEMFPGEDKALVPILGEGPKDVVDPSLIQSKRVYLPEGKSKTYTSEPISALKKEPYNVKTLVEEMPIEQRVERPIEPQPLKVREKPLFPFIPEELAIEKEVPNPLQNLPTAVQPKEQTGFTGTLKTLKKRGIEYPQSYSAKVKGADLNTKPPSEMGEIIEALKSIVPNPSIGPDILEGRVKGKNLKTVESLGTSDLLKEAFADIGAKLSSEQGALSNKEVSGPEKVLADRATRARRELLKRANEIVKSTGERVDEALAELGLSPEMAQKVMLASAKGGQKDLEVATKITPQGDLVPIQKGNQTVPLNIIKNSSEWKDIHGPQKFYKDFDRILEKVTGKDYDKVRQFLTEARESAVTNLILEVSKYKDEVKNYIVKELGIKPGSKTSAAVMKYGEGRLSEADLKKAFPNEWQNIVKANDYYRSTYDKILDEVNAVLESQNKPPIPKRKNYYTHVQEISSLWDQLKNPAAIDPQLVGLSEFTQPTGRWNPFAQKRQGGKFVEDAVEAFDRYLMPTLMQKHLNPVISRYQAFADALAAQSIKTRNLNNLIWTIRMQARSLAGKTNPFDRIFQDAIGRKGMRAVDWAAQRLAANSIVGNLGSAVMQSSSLPQTIAHAGLFNTAKGMLSSLLDATAGKNKAIELSPFLKRRYLNVEPLKKTLTQKAADVASIPMKYFEQFMVESTWRANFNKAFSEGMKQPEAIKYADFQTARQVGDRSLGAKPLMFQSRVANLALQFQYEVNNFTQHMAHDLGFKKKAELGRLMVYSYLFNQAMQGIMNRKPLFDPIAGVVDAVSMDKKPEDSTADDLLKRMGRLGGEVLGNVAGGQTIAGIIPEDVRKKYMGSTEIGMYGAGPPLVGAIQQTIKNPATAITNFGLPFGGGQIKKTLRGVEALSRLPKETKGKTLKMIGFGPYSDKEVGAKYSELKKQDKKKLKKRK